MVPVCGAKLVGRQKLYMCASATPITDFISVEVENIGELIKDDVRSAVVFFVLKGYCPAI